MRTSYKTNLKKIIHNELSIKPNQPNAKFALKKEATTVCLCPISNDLNSSCQNAIS